MQQDRSVLIEQHKNMIIRNLLLTSLCFQLSLTAKNNHWILQIEKYQMLLKEFSFNDPHIVKQPNFKDLVLMKTFLNNNEFVNIGRNIQNINVKQGVKQNALIFIDENDSLENTTKELQILAKGLIPMILVLQDQQFERLYNIMMPAIDNVVYFFKASTEELYEAYKINGRQIQRKLGIVISDTNKFLWKNDINQDFVKRRSDFNGLVLTGMTEFNSAELMNVDPSYIMSAQYFENNDTYLIKSGHTYGLLNDILNELQNRLNFSIILYKRRIVSYGFVYPLQNGSYRGTGMVGDVFFNRVDMAIAPFSIIYRRALYIDYLPPLMPDFVGTFIPTVDENINLTNFIEPYTPRLWIVIFVTAIVFAIFKLILHYHYYSVKIIDVICFLWTSYAAFLGGKPTRTKIDLIESYRLIIFFSLFCGLIVWSTYKAQLKASLTIVRKHYPFQDLESFSRTNWQYVYTNLQRKINRLLWLGSLLRILKFAKHKKSSNICTQYFQV